MWKQKKIMLIASLIVACFVGYLFFQNTDSSKIINVETSIKNETLDKSTNEEKDSPEETTSITSSVEEVVENTDLEKKKQVEVVSVQVVDEEEKKAVEAGTVSEGIKEKVKGVVEGVFKLFEKDLQVVAIGDSLTQGVGDETKNDGYVGIIHNTFEVNNIKVAIENYGKRGNRTDQLVKRLDKKKIKASVEEADIVLVTIGANDIMKIVKSNIMNLQMKPFSDAKIDYIERLDVIFTKIHSLNPNAKIYLIGFYNPFDRYFGDIEEMQMIIDDWNSSGQILTQQYDYVNYIPIADLFVDSDIELLSEDHFHPNSSGYNLMAKRILENIEEISVVREEINEDIE
ncbi:lysophospholipase L1-like esterase [Metabacillus crassostreae]|uniref:SGNH/GDSL hydrolase family protein n=1 Tax=Metabacillus crassostreae TaxID=929098 RepID=UPI001EF8FBFF|nr:SGNH/GDSL hydrolase family protein [Metabacillus crassostreae]MBM7602542.1 lysophospholipase L1-like esterase [Metabacillus crassostreae]